MTADAELPESAFVDPWAGHLPGQDLVPAYLVSRFAAQYRVIVEALLDAQETSLTGVAFVDLTDLMRAQVARRISAEAAERLFADAGFSVDARLVQLHRWGVVTKWQEPARTGEDFLRRRDRYQLTPAAARLHMFWIRQDGDDDAAADLTLAPRAIRDRLEAFAAALTERAYPAAANEYQQVIAVHQAMAGAARTWQRALAHAVSGSPDPEKQEVLLATLQSYVRMWGEQVDTHSSRISALLDTMSETLTDQVWRACARAAMDDAPDALVDDQVRRWTATWTTLRTWFAGPEGQARRLRRQLRDLVAPWARNMALLMESGGAVTRRAELLRLATVIERAPDDAVAWRMWDTATGGFPARHLLVPADGAEDATDSWTTASPAPITARYREQGAKAAVGRRPDARDFSSGRAAARRERAAALAERREAEAALRQRSGTRLSSWDRVTEPELDVLLELFGLARGSDGTAARTAVTTDGRFRVTLTPVPDGPDTAQLLAPTGRLIMPDCRFELEPAS
ncbi:DUF2397 domain-containing protein [Pseudonocardia sp.]|uniref:DUF2397 domain-containing protein n=1 Tax=Pseudonocardia sp. TaxID=60912 RepID=UPI0031FC8DC2